MSREVSPAAGRPYGVQRVCRTWRVARSTQYAQERAAAAPLSRPRWKWTS